MVVLAVAVGFEFSFGRLVPTATGSRDGAGWTGALGVGVGLMGGSSLFSRSWRSRLRRSASRLSCS